MSGGIVDVLGVLLEGEASMDWSGGEISSLLLLDAAQIRIAGLSFQIDGIAGLSFQIDGVPVAPGMVDVSSGLLTGTLANGDALSVPFERTTGTRLFLVPEPSTFGLLALGLAALAGRSARARPGC